MKRSIAQCLDNDAFGEVSKNVSPVNTADYFKPEMFSGYRDSNSSPSQENSLNLLLNASQYMHRESLTIIIVSSQDSSKKASLCLSSQQIDNICRESQFWANAIQDYSCNNGLTASSPMSPMRTASPLAASMRSSSPMKYNQSSNRVPASPKSRPLANEGLVIVEEHIREAIYLLGVIADLEMRSDLSILPLRFNVVWAALSAKWKVSKFTEFFTKLMDRELAKLLDTRTCDIVMVSDSNQCVFVPHPKKPNSYLSKKNGNVSSIELLNNVQNNNMNAFHWELTICIRKPDNTVAVGRMNFPCKSNTLLQDCSGVWDGHQLRFRLAPRDERYTKAFVLICDLIKTYECFRHGIFIRSNDDMIKILCHHHELWTKQVFDELFTREELTDFLLNNCIPKQ